MMLVEIEIEDYKQYTGCQTITVPRDGVVGVIGANGVGKTTLFEAIEWCLYAPSAIPTKDVRPRGQSTTPRVKVTLENTQTGERWTIERILKKASMTASVYRTEAPDQPIVTGSKQVQDYVATKLIGLSYTAFVSTFFTRQKELSFFGTLTPTERRRNVGRLLGFETIRVAQGSIADKRNDAKNAAKAARDEYDSKTASGDFDALIADATKVADARAADSTAAEAVKQRVEADYNKARNVLKHHQNLREQEQGLLSKRSDLDGKIGIIQAHVKGYTGQLQELDLKETERAGLATIAAELPERSLRLAEQEVAKARSERRRTLDAQVRSAGLHVETQRKNLVALVGDAHPGVLPGWAVTNGDFADLPTAVQRLVGISYGIDTRNLERQTRAMETAYSCAQERDDATTKVAQYEARLQQLHDQLAALCTPEHPELAQRRLRDERAALNEAIAAERSKIGLTQAEIDRYAELMATLQEGDFDAGCPTCGRSFSVVDRDLSLRAFQNQIDALKETIRLHESEIGRIGNAVSQLDARASPVEDQRAEVDKAEKAIQTGTGMLQEKQTAVQRATEELVASLALLPNGKEPSLEAVQQTRAQTDRLMKVANAGKQLEQIGQALGERISERGEAEAELQQMGPDTFDEQALQSAKHAVIQATQAEAQVKEIEKALKMRPTYERELAAASRTLALREADRVAVDRELADVGFDQNALTEANTAEFRLMNEARKAADDASKAALSASQAANDRKNLIAEKDRLADVALRADVKQREADELDQMYKEFNGFEQFAANRVTPELAAHTSELLKEVTQGKYDLVDFDDNYGISVFDGPDNAFPLETFSGGERDVVALCARLALSRLIGSQAAHPPSFLVLDEVFGSLDLDRRQRLLETLGALQGSAEAFRQLFIISHIDDVRLSPVMSDVWHVQEAEDGGSVLSPLAVGAGIGDL